MSHQRCIQIEISHELYDTNYIPLRCNTTSYTYNHNDFNLPISSITVYWQHLVTLVVGANLQSVQRQLDEKWVEVDESYLMRADGTFATISNLATLTFPGWSPDDTYTCTIALKFQYLMDDAKSAALPGFCFFFFSFVAIV